MAELNSKAKPRSQETQQWVAAQPGMNGRNPSTPLTNSVHDQAIELRPRKDAQVPAAVPSPNGRAAPEERPRGFNRRELLFYSWGLALGALAVGGGTVTYQFMRPHFQTGEFGGRFQVGAASALPAISAAPRPEPMGRYWLVNTQEGPRAIYMVCTHLGCLCKWEGSRNRFECPCHGSKYTREGHYIEGPAPRSLDQFVVEVVEKGRIQARSQADDTGVIPPQFADAHVQLVVDTGRRILGRPRELSPAFQQG